MGVMPYTPESYDLLHQGAITLAEVECNGMRVDTGYLKRALVETKEKARQAAAELEPFEVYKVWRQMYRSDTNLTSDAQLAAVLYDRMGYQPTRTTDGKRQSVDEEALAAIDDPFVPKYLRYKKLKKAGGTFLTSILRETVDDYVHCFFNLHTAKTYRSSSEDFNFQNLPVRDPEIMKLIRSAFIARPGRQIVEIDFKGAEVTVAACYHYDPAMIRYITDKSLDMHRDMAAKCFRLPVEEVTKAIRHCGKNQFVFPEFYGDYYLHCAQILWKSVDQLQLKTASGKSLREHLHDVVGLQELGSTNPKDDPEVGTFIYHLKEVEKWFWEEMFPVYAQWKKEWYQAYREKGWFLTHTGFICQGFMGRNDVINYPVQGSAFHLLLWSLIQLVRKEMKRRGMRSLIVGQIHDSIVADVVPSERDEFLALCRYIMTKKIFDYAPWLVIPMEIEAEVAPVGAPWAEKKGYEIPN